MTTVGVIFAVPFVIVMLGMWIISNEYKKGRLLITRNKLLTSYLAFLFIFIAAMLVFSQNIAAFMAKPDALNLVSTVLTGGVTSFVAFGVMKSSDYTARLERETVVHAPFQISKNSGIIISSTLAFIAVILTYVIFTLNPITQAMEFGIGLGIDLILAGIIIRVYRLVEYHE
jgi:hypothetical protein